MVKDALDCAMLNNKSNSSVILSTMATAKTHGEESPYFTGWKEYDKNPYDQHMNPSGIIQMGLAENQVSFDLLEEWLYEHPEASICQEGKTTFRDTALHEDYHGLPAFREALVRFMEMVRGGKVRFDPDRIVLTAGATAATELLMFCLANPGEAFLVPTPYYPGFDRDLRWRTGVEIIPVHCHSSNDFQVTSSALEEAYHEAKQRNIRVKGILVTNPSNPLGTTLERKTLKNLLSFASEKNIHLICDEIYSGSVFVPPNFVSIAEVLEGSGRPNDSDRVHIVYSLSKDLGLPGFRVGAIYSYNDTVVTTARRMSSFSLVSSQTQHFLACMLSDEDFTKKYMKENQKRLRKRHRIMVSGLQKAGISCLKSNAGLFCWVNLTQLLPSENVDGEIKLWETILYEMGLNVSPGSSCHCIEPGWFRVCFANMSEHTLQVSLQRIQGFMNSKGRNKSNNLITAARNL